MLCVVQIFMFKIEGKKYNYSVSHLFESLTHKTIIIYPMSEAYILISKIYCSCWLLRKKVHRFANQNCCYVQSLYTILNYCYLYFPMLLWTAVVIYSIYTTVKCCYLLYVHYPELFPDVLVFSSKCGNALCCT